MMMMLPEAKSKFRTHRDKNIQFSISQAFLSDIYKNGDQSLFNNQYFFDQIKMDWNDDDDSQNYNV